MILTINRAPFEQQAVGRSMHFAARDIDNDFVTISISADDWQAVASRWSADPISKIEWLARRPEAGWRWHGAFRVWRVSLQ